jgi:hypothetical protein
MRWFLVSLLLLTMVAVSCQANPALPTKTPLSTQPSETGLPFNPTPSPEKPPSTQPPETSLPSTPTPSAEEAIALAKKQLAQQLAIAESEIELVSIRDVLWPDTSLGVPEAGKVYAQVIVPGFRIVLSAKGKEYIYHAGKPGEKTVVIPAPPQEEERKSR